MHQVQRSSLHSAVTARRNGPAFAALAVAIALGLGANAHAATFTVLNNTDADPGSLRAAIDAANLAPGADEIVFDAAVTGQIALASHITILDHLRIAGPGLTVLALDGGENNRIFRIEPSDGIGAPTTLAVTIEGLTLQNGFSGSDGGCIDAEDTALEVVDSLITGCRAGEGSGGGISLSGYVNYGGDYRSSARGPRDGKGQLPPEPGQASLILRNTRVENNSAWRSGGGVSALIVPGANAPDGFQMLDESSVTGNNTGSGPGGGVEVYGYDPFGIEVRDSTISGNTADSNLGGGLVVYQENNAGSSLVIADSTISNNRLNLSYSGPFVRGGGGVSLLTGANVQISGSTLEGNIVAESTKANAKGSSAPDLGGAILLQPSDALPSFDLSDSRIAGNGAPYGGGVALTSMSEYGPPGKAQKVGYWRANARARAAGTSAGKGAPAFQWRIEDSVFESNAAAGASAILSFAVPAIPSQPPPKGDVVLPTIVFERITLQDNTASGDGLTLNEGALVTLSLGISTQLINSTVSGNSGGGVVMVRPFDEAGESLLIDNSTIVGNIGRGVGQMQPTPPPERWAPLLAAAGKARSGEKAYPAQTFPIAIRNSIVQGNTDLITGDPTDIVGDLTEIHLLHSLIGMAEADLTGYDNGGGNLFAADPLLGPLANNGGSTPTHLPLFGSPAIDAGDPDFAVPPATDQRDLPRIAGVALDMGAVETVPPVPGTLQFDPASATVNETDGTVTLTVTRTDGDDGEVGVSFASADGSATTGLDFTAVTDTLTWADGDSAAKTIDVPILDDAEVEVDETFDVTLSAPTGNATLGSAITATVTIVSEDLPPDPVPGTLQFDPTSATVNETAGTVTLTVTRVGGDDGEVGVSFATAEGTASGGADFTTGAGTLTWTDGDSAAKTIDVPILDDDEVETDETFDVALSAPTGDATLGSADTATVTIVSDDLPPDPVPGVLGFDPIGYVVDEGAGSATLTVTRTGGSDGAVSVDFSSIDAGATAGSDYSAVDGTLSWEDGDTAPKTLSVPIIDDSEDEEDEDLNVTLSNPTGDATLGSDGASVTIGDNDEAPPPGIVQFDNADDDGVLRLRIREDGSIAPPAKGLLTLRVVRMAGSEGPASVAFTTVDGTATAPSDFVAQSGELNWADGEDGDKTIVLDIVEDDDTVEPDESFSVVLSDAQGAGLGGNLQAQIVIIANGAVEPPPAALPAVIPANDWRGRIALFGGLLIAAWVALRKRF